MCIICDDFRKRRDLADARRMLIAARREPKSIDRAHLDKVEKDLDEYEAAAKTKGFSIIEVMVALAITGILTYVVTAFLRQSDAGGRYLRARSALLEDTDRIFAVVRRSWTTRDRQATGGGFELTSTFGGVTDRLAISLRPQGGAAGVPNTTITWETKCRPVPDRLGLSSAQVQVLANIAQAACGIACPSGANERPIVEVTNPDTGGVPQQIPSDQSGPSREAVLALAACFQVSGDNLEVVLHSAIMRANGDIQAGERRFQLRTTDEFGSGIEVLR